MAECLNGNGNGDIWQQLATPTRNRYFYGKLLDAFHFDLEQSYFNRKRWLLNRLGLGMGVMCGLNVVATEDGQQVWIQPGVAIDGLGREIVVPAAYCLQNPRQPTDACGQPSGEPVNSQPVLLCLAYHECPAEPAPVLVGDCDTRQGCAPSTVQERYRLLVQTGVDAPAAPACGLPDLFTPAEGEEQANVYPRLVERLSQACPEPEGVCVVLARLNLPAEGEAITQDMIDLNVRPLVYSNNLLFELLLCLAERVETCCQPPAMLLYVSGDSQVAPVNATVPAPLVVQVLQNGAPVANEPVTFEVSVGGGQVGLTAASLGPNVSIATGADGRASLPLWQLGPNPGDNRVSARIAAGVPLEFVFQATATPVEVTLPVVRAIWPPSAALLAPNQDQNWFSIWSDTPHLEITFDRQMADSQLAAPEPWLRLWEIRPLGQNQVQVRRLNLGFAGPVAAPVLGESGVTEAYKVELSPDTAGGRVRYLVQMRAEGANIVDTSSPPLLLDADFSGTALKEPLDRIWETTNVDTFGQEVWDGLVDTGAVLPASGDGTAGGRFHSWFEVVSG